jgi:hypothetical protein
LMPNRFRVLDCLIERTGEAESVSGSLSESNPLIDQSSQLDTRVLNLAFFTHFSLLQICVQRLDRRRA